MHSGLRRAADDLLVRYGGDTFDRLFSHAKGSAVFDDQGRRVLNFTSGQICATVGHNHPAILAAIQEACDTALHMYSGMIPEVVAELAQILDRD